VIFAAAVAAQAAPFVRAVELDVGQHSIATPFAQLARVSPFDPAVSLAAEHPWVRAGAFTLAQQARVGFAAHSFTGHTALVGTDLLARVTLPAGPMAELGLGVAAVDTWRSQVLVRDGESYVPATDKGALGAALGAQLALGFELGRVTPLVQYRWYAQTPFLPALPVGPHSNLSLGVRWSFGGES
jgi:hypothetical protein